MTKTQSTQTAPAASLIEHVGGIAEGDRIYPTTYIVYSQARGADLIITSDDEGTVIGYTGSDCCDLLVEWDCGEMGAVDSGSVALVD